MYNIFISKYYIYKICKNIKIGNMYKVYKYYINSIYKYRK